MEEGRAKIAAYLNHLISLGIDGFRINAAKHIWTDDIANILSRLNPRLLDGQPVEVFQEVIFRDTSEAVTASSQSFRGSGPTGIVPSDKAVVFTDNHDDQRKTPHQVTNLKCDG